MKKFNSRVNNSQNIFSSGLINNLQPFFLTNMDVVKKSNIIKPNQMDSLFWCFYILKNGLSSYEKLFQCGVVNTESLHNNLTKSNSSSSDMQQSSITYVREKQIKIRLVEELRDPIIRNKLKKCKLCSIDHVEDQLANEKVIDLSTFFSLCFIFDIQLFYFKNKCYYKTLKGELPWMRKDVENEKEKETDIFEQIYDRYGTGYDEDDYDFETIYVLKQTNGKYWVECKNVLDIEWNQCYQIENVNKPLKGISSYTSAEIKELSKIFCLDIKGKNKQEIYDMVKLIVKIDII